MRFAPVFAMLVFTLSVHAQWVMQTSHATADLRGIDNVGDGVAWASGTRGAVLRTVDGGTTWQVCAVPRGAETLDFRGVQGFDAKTAIVMSSGLGDQSRLYKTTDGCQTWKLVFTNPDKDGFWDALVAGPHGAFLVGDPVGGRFVLYRSRDARFETWERFGEATDLFHFPYDPARGEALFAASNSSVEGDPASDIAFVTGGESGARFYAGAWNERAGIGQIGAAYFDANLPFPKGAGAGAFSLAVYGSLAHRQHYVAVGGDYMKAASADGTAAFSTDGGTRWKPAKTLPHGYRSAVAYDNKLKVWIAVGPNGTDVSFDDGRNWRALRAGAEDAVDADKNWNALSLPFVVGPHGRIGVLRESAVAELAKDERGVHGGHGDARR